ncbi:hypothetical protein [Hyphomicrobium sp.]|uniref:hypothetical protein n=1 Tax=Hyphomicrobium sp. TaxID=82 RepID=UPI000F9EB6B1|nr:hypothetical protein [Hyphomicrobium sp.]RUO99236.1 MAG: hypothetical protein EKK30_08375 [Hyphomicrobium sp.]
MRRTIALSIGLALTVQSTVVLAENGSKSPLKFQMCEADDPQKCAENRYLPCGTDPGVAALISCQKDGWKFFTLAKAKSEAGGQCGATVFNVTCQ